MNNNINIEGYLNTVNAPWGKLFYRLLWHNLEYKGKRILDFGSGFGITADHFAERNEVIALEPNEDMIRNRFQTNTYEQIEGGIDKLRELPDHSFDAVFCHNVMEYLDERVELLQEFHRVLKKDGFVSIVKHNKTGKIMHKAVFDNNVDAALELLNEGKDISQNFGMINEYELAELSHYCKGLFRISKLYGIRTFFGLQRNEYKSAPDWVEKMFILESAVESIPEFQNVAAFHHVILEPQEGEVIDVHQSLREQEKMWEEQENVVTKKAKA